MDWMFIKPSIEGYFEYINKSNSSQIIKKSDSNFSRHFKNDDPTLKYFLFDQFSVQYIYNNYLNFTRGFDLLQSIYEFRCWIKTSKFASLVHQIIDMLVKLI